MSRHVPSPKTYRRRSRLVPVAATIVVSVMGFGGPPARASGSAAPISDLSLFDARAVGSVVSFSFHVPEAVFPFQIVGGMLESTTLATSTPQAFGLAGLAPVPLASSVGLVIPRVVPGTQIPVPDDVQDAFKSIDFTALPNSCQASFPPLTDGGDQATCGGPYQADSALGFTAAGLNGLVRATGDFDDPFATRMSAISRGGDITVPGLQAKFHQAYSESATGINDAGVPQGRSAAEIDSLALLGNLIHLEGIHSETIVATNGLPDGTVARSTLTVRGATVFGIPVLIGPDGVTINKEQVPAAELRTATAKVEAALSQNGNIRMRLVPAPPVETRNGEVTAQSGALEIAYVARTPTPVDVVQRFAYTQARVNAVPGHRDTDPSQGVSPELPLPSADPPLAGAAETSTGPSADPGRSEHNDTAGPWDPTGTGRPVPGATSIGTSGGQAIDAPVLSGEPTPPRPGFAASTGRALHDRKALVLANALGPATRTRLNALYGATVVLSALGFALIPLRRRLVPTRPPAAR